MPGRIRSLLIAFTALVAAAVVLPAQAVPRSGPPPIRPVCAAPAQPAYATCFALERTDVTPQQGIVLDPAGFGPADLQDAYDLPSGSAGDGQRVAVVAAYDNPTVAEDLAVYRQQFGLPACSGDDGCFTKVNQRGEQTGLPALDKGWAAEIALGVDMVSAACPRCRILLVEADSPSVADLAQAANTAVQLGAKYVSSSYGTDEFAGQSAYDAYYDHPGVAMVAPSGNVGHRVLFPASSPHVTAVGGTALQRDSGERDCLDTIEQRVLGLRVQA
ncbi:hypothetical protein ACXC9Q_17755 [Kribbella sp. CWNU-51]